MRSPRALVCYLALVVAAGCQSDMPTASNELGLPLATISDGAHGGTPGFYFLAPTVAQPRNLPAQESFDGSLPVTIEIRQLDGISVGALVASFSTRVTGQNAVSVNSRQGHYQAEWHTRNYNLDPTKHYRILVKVAGTTLGHADVAVVRNGAELNRVDASQYVGVLAGSVLPIRFWIGRGYVAVVGSAGGTISLLGGTLALVVPANAVSVDVGFAATPVTGVPSGNGAVAVAGAAYDFAPDGIVFAQPVQLTITYNENGLAGQPESSLRLHKLVNGAWQPVPGSTVDPNANTVSGAINGFSIYGVVTLVQGQPLFTGWGTATVDGVFAAGEWEFAASRDFTINVAGGATAPATMYIMNDGTNLYIAVKIVHSVNYGGIRYGIKFDANNNGIDEAGEDRFVGGLESGVNKFQDQHTSTACGFDRCSDAQNGGTDDGASDMQFHGTHYIVESSRPLDSADNLNDFSLAAGDTIGFSFALFIFDEPPNDNGYLTEFPGATTYARILIQPADEPVLSGSGGALMDGIMNVLEWQYAACIFVEIEVPEGGVTPGKWCVMNDTLNIYMGLTYARNVVDQSAFARMTLDKNASNAIDNGDDFFGYEAYPGVFRDGYWEVGTALCPVSICEINDVDGGGQVNGAGAFGQTATHAVFEQKHPLSGTDVRDVSLSKGDDIGVSLALFLTNAANQSSATFLGSGGVKTIKVKIQ